MQRDDSTVDYLLTRPCKQRALIFLDALICRFPPDSLEAQIIAGCTRAVEEEDWIMDLTKFEGHTPGPWRGEFVPCTGFEIFAPVYACESVALPQGIDKPMQIWSLAPKPQEFVESRTKPQPVLIAYERWVQFEPKGWEEMQRANMTLMTAAPDLLELAKLGLELVDAILAGKDIGGYPKRPTPIDELRAGASSDGPSGWKTICEKARALRERSEKP